MSKIYPHDRFDRLIEKTVAQLHKLGKLKGGEYAGDEDRLANFRRNGVQLALPMETVWSVYYNKHHDAVMQFVRDLNEGKSRERLEGIDGRVDDMILYLILFKAMLDEREAEPTKQAVPRAARRANNPVKTTDPKTEEPAAGDKPAVSADDFE